MDLIPPPVLMSFVGLPPRGSFRSVASSQLGAVKLAHAIYQTRRSFSSVVRFVKMNALDVSSHSHDDPASEMQQNELDMSPLAAYILFQQASRVCYGCDISAPSSRV